MSKNTFRHLLCSLLVLLKMRKSEQEFIEEQKRLLGNNAVELVRSNYDWGKSLLSKGVITENEFDVLDQMGGTADGTRLLPERLETYQVPKELPIPSFTEERKTKRRVGSVCG